MNELLKQVRANKDTLKVLREQEVKQDEKFWEEKRKVERAFDDEIYKIQDKKRDVIGVLEEDKKKRENVLKLQEQELYKPLTEVKKIFKVFDIKLKKYKEELKTPQVYYFDYLKDKNGYSYGEKVKFFYNPLMTIRNNKFIKLFAYITTNRKPLNKFSLIVVGNTYLNGLVRENMTYGIDAHTQDYNIRQLIKDFKTEEDARAYLNKNEQKLLKEWLLEHDEAEKYYNEKVTLWEDLEFKIAYWEDKKDYYENGYSHGTETEEYKAICERLEQLNSEIKDD